MHLFAYDNGRERYDEARTLRAGRTPVAFDADGWRVGLSVCYDLRFPELYRALMRPPCDLLSVPSAFTYTTGAAHWELLLRARAVENQCYVVAAGAGRPARERPPHLRPQPGRRSVGRGPRLSRTKAKASSSPSSSRSGSPSVRSQLPALEHRLAF